MPRVAGAVIEFMFQFYVNLQSQQSEMHNWNGNFQTRQENRS